MDKLFTVHKLNQTGMEKAKKIAGLFDGLLESLKKECVDGREFGSAKMKLEEACFLSKKAMAVNPQNREFVQPADNVVDHPVGDPSKNIVLRGLSDDGKEIIRKTVSQNELNSMVVDGKKLWFSQESKDAGDMYWELDK